MQTALTPIERGVLIVLMAQGRPLGQAELKKVHGLNVKTGHRRKLIERGLIEAGGARPLTLALTKMGWEWLQKELTAPKPKGVMGLGPLYAALGAIHRLTGRLGVPLEKALREEPHEEVPDEHVHAAAWDEADGSLARALQDIPILTSAIGRLKEAANGAARAEVKRAEQSVKLVLQYVRQAAVKRELNVAGPVGAEVSFDPSLFESGDNVAAGDKVRVRKPAITRGEGCKKVVIRQGEAEAIL